MPTPNISLSEPKARGDAYNAIKIMGFREDVESATVKIEWCWAWRDDVTGVVTADATTRQSTSFGSAARDTLAAVTLQSHLDAGRTTFGEAKDYLLLQSLIDYLVATSAIVGGTIT